MRRVEKIEGDAETSAFQNDMETFGAARRDFPNTEAGGAQSVDASNAEPDPEPRWVALVAMLAVGGLFAALPASLSIVPRWWLLAIVAVLLVPTIVAHRAGYAHLNQLLGTIVTGIVTAAMIGSLALLVRALPEHKESPTALLISAVSLWITNILIFALWYWRLDAGGPNRRDARIGHPTGAFLFPQMTIDRGAKTPANIAGDLADVKLEAWSPEFIDYLFIAFNTSTAFSPTDTPVLSRWAKVLTMLQATISLAVIALLAARSVNIL